MYLRFFLPIVFAVLVTGMASFLPQAEADHCIFDGNSVVCIDVNESPITSFWGVDTGSIVNEGSTYFRGGGGQEMFICELEDVSEGEGPADFECVATPTRLTAFESTEGSREGNSFFGEFDGSLGVDIDITWLLTGGPIGTPISTLEETIEIKRVNEGSSSYRFFQETVWRVKN